MTMTDQLSNPANDDAAIEAAKEAAKQAATEFVAGILSKAKDRRPAFRRDLIRYIIAAQHASGCEHCRVPTRSMREAATMLGEYGVLSPGDMHALYAHAMYIHDPDSTITLSHQEDAA